MTDSLTWQELVSQPARWRQITERPVAFPPLWCRAADDVVVFGSGSSFYLAQLVGGAIQDTTGHRVQVLPSCELILDAERALAIRAGRPCLAVAFSRSGESTEALIATQLLHDRGIAVMGVTCTAESSLARHTDACLLVPEGAEDGLVMLRSFTGMLLACLLALGQAGDAERLVQAGEQMLQNLQGPISALANQRPFDRFVFLGSGADFPMAQEAALKLQEMAAVTTEAYYTLEYRHGPRATGGANTLATMFTPALPEYGVSLIQDLKAQGLATLVIGDTQPYAATATAMAATDAGLPARLRQMLALLPVHLLAYATAVRRQQDPGAPPNLAKVVLL